MADIHKGPCADCERPMIDQREWARNPCIRPGHRKEQAHGLCQACYTRWSRHGKLPTLTVTLVTTYTVACDKCGLIDTADTREEATQMRSDHLGTHGLRAKAAPLPDSEVMRLRRMVGLAS